jgi:hypothetical protein
MLQALLEAFLVIAAAAARYRQQPTDGKQKRKEPSPRARSSHGLLLSGMTRFSPATASDVKHSGDTFGQRGARFANARKSTKLIPGG